MAMKSSAMRMRTAILYFAAACAGAIGSQGLTIGHFGVTRSVAQTPAAATSEKSTELFNQVMEDVLGRRLIVRLTERDPADGSAAHRHPGSHTVGYILEGSYEVKIEDGPLRFLGPGEIFYEPPNALHAISRNPSRTQTLKYLVIQVSDPTKASTVPEPSQ
jgi:quercetin dioxygenase-like cupin family protein